MAQKVVIWGPGGLPLVVDATGAIQVSGNVASAVADTGNPVKVGGVFRTTQPTLTDGQRGDGQFNSRGALRVEVQGGGGGTLQASTAYSNDGLAYNTQGALFTHAFNALYNETAHDRQRPNTQTIPLGTVGGRITTQTVSNIVNWNARGGIWVLDMTNPGTASITFSLTATHPGGGTYTILTGTAVTTVSTNIYRVYPGLVAVANATVNDILPRLFNVVVTVGNANGCTYSVSQSLVL